MVRINSFPDDEFYFKSVSKEGNGAILGEFDEGCTYYAKKNLQNNIPGHLEFFKNIEESLKEIRLLTFGSGVIKGFITKAYDAGDEDVKITIDPGIGCDKFGNFLKLKEKKEITVKMQRPQSNFVNSLRILARHKIEKKTKISPDSVHNIGFIPYMENIEFFTHQEMISKTNYQSSDSWPGVNLTQENTDCTQLTNVAKMSDGTFQVKNFTINFNLIYLIDSLNNLKAQI